MLFLPLGWGGGVDRPSLLVCFSPSFLTESLCILLHALIFTDICPLYSSDSSALLPLAEHVEQGPDSHPKQTRGTPQVRSPLCSLHRPDPDAPHLRCSITVCRLLVSRSSTKLPLMCIRYVPLRFIQKNTSTYIELGDYDKAEKVRLSFSWINKSCALGAYIPRVSCQSALLIQSICFLVPQVMASLTPQAIPSGSVTVGEDSTKADEAQGEASEKMLTDIQEDITNTAEQGALVELEGHKAD